MLPNVDPDALAFFNGLSGRLEIELTEAPERISPALQNLRASPSATIARLSLRAEVYERESASGPALFRPLTEDELERVVIRDPQVTLIGEGRDAITFDAPNGASFTVRDLLAAVEETERRSRGDSEWYGGIDVHHVFFQGIHYDTDGLWRISWGS